MLATTAHPDYALIAISNRDEFIHRPTARASVWSNEDILAGQDLERSSHGTWLGITRASGRFAVLTNCREAYEAQATDAPRSRGEMVSHFLRSELPTCAYVESLTQNMNDFGGFTMVCGQVQSDPIDPLAVVSNRQLAGTKPRSILGERGAYAGISNLSYDAEEQWPKVKLGLDLLRQCVERQPRNLIPELFAVLRYKISLLFYFCSSKKLSLEHRASRHHHHPWTTSNTLFSFLPS